MIQKVEAVYENGVLRPLTRLTLSESQRVTLTITGADLRPDPRDLLDLDLLERARAEVAAMSHRPTIEEVRALLATIPGSLSEDVIAERGDY